MLTSINRGTPATYVLVSYIASAIWQCGREHPCWGRKRQGSQTQDQRHGRGHAPSLESGREPPNLGGVRRLLGLVTAAMQIGLI